MFNRKTSVFAGVELASDGLKDFFRAVFSKDFYVWIVRIVNHYQHLHFSKIRLITRGKNTVIAPTAVFGHAQNIFIGDNCLVNHYCTLNANTEGKIIIGNDVILGPGVYVATASHSFKKGELIRNQELEQADIIIGNDVWIGANSIILKGAVIEDGCVIGANTVVPKNTRIPKNSIAVGVPAKVIKKRE